MKALSNPYLATLLLSLTAKAAVAERLMDPTLPATAPIANSKVPEALRVEAILRSSSRVLAIVNGRIVRAGDRVGDAQVEAILPDGVRYSRDGASHVARLAQRPLAVRQGRREDPT